MRSSYLPVLALLAVLSLVSLPIPAARADDAAPPAKVAPPDPCKPGGPMVTLTAPSGSGEEDEDTPPLITETETFVLQTNCAVNTATVPASVWFEAENVKSKYAVQLVTGTAREAELAKRGLAGRDNLLVLRAKLAFPFRSKVELVWGKGVRSTSGIERSEPQRFRYEVRPTFSVGVRCEHTFADGSCDPFLPVYAVFSAPVPPWAGGEYQFPDAILLRSASGQEWHGAKSAFHDNDRDVPALKFAAPFPPRESLSLIVPDTLQDTSGRLLENRAALPLAVKIGKIPPMVHFSAIFGIVESHAGGALPVTVRSLAAETSGAPVAALRASVAQTRDPKQVLEWLTAVQNRYEEIEKNTSSIFGTAITAAAESRAVDRPGGADPFEVVGIPFSKPGFYAVEVASPEMGSALKGSGTIMYVPTTALVTNLAVHAKLGAESSLVWVTALDTGTPVAGAEVRIFNCAGGELFKGVSDAGGIVRIGLLPGALERSSCGLDTKYVSVSNVANAPLRDGALLVSAAAGEDFAFTLSTWDEGIEPWRYGLSQDYSPEQHRVGWSVFDRTLFRRGETVHMKHFLRRKVSDGFALPASAELPAEIELVHSGSGDKFDLPLNWRASGSAENEWAIPADVKLGDYNAYFKANDGRVDYRSIGAFSVLDYRVPLMHADIIPPKDEVLTPPNVPVDVAIRYLAGGGASALPIKLRYQVQPSHYSFAGAFEDFTFAQEIEAHAGRNSADSEEEEESDDQSNREPPPPTPLMRSVSAALDDSGTARVVLDKIPAITRPAKLFTELEFKDPNGEIQTVSSSLPLLPSPYLVGIKTDTWLQTKSRFSFSVAVVNGRGEAQKQVPVNVRLYQREVYTHRKKVVGGSFMYENQSEDVDHGSICAGVTDERGIAVCKVTMPLAGDFILEATAKDAQGRASATASSIFVGDDDYWFAQQNTDRVDLLPEKKLYESGETARFQVRTPFKEATALVTIEREGVLDAFVTKLSRANPVVELPVKDNYTPNVFVSVLAVRGRIDEARPTATFDPGKPAFRLGMAQIKVGWRPATLKVSASSPKQVYKVREHAPIHVTVRTAAGAVPPAGSEVAIAAVDEGLLELKPNESWDLLQAMMGVRPLSVHTYTAQMFVLGKRHFGLKALPFGGGGGKALTRELFDTLLYWNPSVMLNEKGEADVEVPLNDSITSFRIVAIASGGAGMFGTGSTAIRSNKDFVLLSGLPPTVRNGDAFTSEFTVRNTTDQPATVELRLRETSGAIPVAPVQTAELAAGASKVVSWNLTAPAEGDALTFEASLTRGDAVEDSLKISQKVLPAVPLRVVHADLAQLQKPISIPLNLPAGADPKRGGERLTITATLGEDLGSLRDYMRAYPFGCLEQRVSKAVALDDKDAWSGIASALPTYLDRDGFAKYFPSQDRGSEVLTSYVLAISDAAGYELPDGAQQKMIDALKRFVAGKIRTQSFRYLDEFYSELGYKNGALSTSELDLLTRKIAALEALSRYEAADPALLNGLWSSPQNLPTESVVELLGATLRMSELPERAKRLQLLQQAVRERLDTHGTLLQFNSEKNERFFWNMTSADVTAVRFADMVFSEDELFKQYESTAGRLVRGILERQDRGHWDLTVANAWGALALQRQHERLSAAPVSGVTKALAGEVQRSLDWAQPPGIPQLLFPWRAQSSSIAVSHEGSGAPWVLSQTVAAVARTAPISEGYVVQKIVEPISQKVAGETHVGDVLRITLKVTAQGTKTWVVVEDPVPSGASILGSGLSRDSALLTSGTPSGGYDSLYPEFEERAFDAYRAYFQEVPRGDFSTQYVVRMNTAGTFNLPATHVEAMYAPDVFGEAPNAVLTVLP